MLEIRSDPMPDGSLIQTYTDITELARAKEAAEAAARAKASFLATMSHEVRTPLNGVIGAAQLMRQTALTRDQKELVDTITASGGALLVVINDILDYSKFESTGVSHLKTIRPASLRKSLRSALECHTHRLRIRKAYRFIARALTSCPMRSWPTASGCAKCLSTSLAMP